MNEEFDLSAQPAEPSPISAAAAGTFAIGGELRVARLGFGALHTVGRLSLIHI